MTGSLSTSWCMKNQYKLIGKMSICLCICNEMVPERLENLACDAEYGGKGRVSTRGDIYSLGIVVLETMTRKKPTDAMFNQELSLRQWVNEAFPHSIVDVIDDNLLTAGNGMQSLFLAILELGLACSRELPEERTEIEDVVNKLSKIKLQLLRSTNTRAS